MAELPPQTPGDSLSLIAEKLERLGCRWMVVGSVAAFLYGYTRSTVDIDIVVGTSGLVPERTALAFEPEYMLDPLMAAECADMRRFPPPTSRADRRV